MVALGTSLILILISRSWSDSSFPINGSIKNILLKSFEVFLKTLERNFTWTRVYFCEFLLNWKCCVFGTCIDFIKKKKNVQWVGTAEQQILQAE